MPGQRRTSRSTTCALLSTVPPCLALCLLAAPQPECGRQGEQQGDGQQQEGVREGGGTEVMERVYRAVASLPPCGEERPDDRRSGPAAEKEQAVEDPQSHPRVLLR